MECGVFCFYNGTGDRTVHLESPRCRAANARSCMMGLPLNVRNMIDIRFGKTTGTDHCNDGERHGCQRKSTCRSSGSYYAQSIMATCSASAPEPVTEPRCAISDPFFLSYEDQCKCPDCFDDNPEWCSSKFNCTENCSTTTWSWSSSGANLRPHFLLVPLFALFLGQLTP